MSPHPIDDLVADIKRRPLPYAVLAAAGVAGAVVLASKAPGTKRTVAKVATAAVAAQLAKRSAETVEPTESDGESAVGEDERIERAVRAAVDRMGLSRSTVAVFGATLLGKAVTGYFRVKGEEKARRQGFGLGAADGTPTGDEAAPLEERTVAELRELAATHEISGRSSMNKDELVSSLAKV